MIKNVLSHKYALANITCIFNAKIIMFGYWSGLRRFLKSWNFSFIFYRRDAPAIKVIFLNN